ncbi:MAG: pyridoxal-phosphate dependent enzyme [Acidobacteriota bacterium]|nr:pyridoxal-phosphate dependent enzyme [Acidobacteriota bacterium]
MVDANQGNTTDRDAEAAAGETPLVLDAVAAAPAGKYLSELQDQRAIARDPQRPLEERLEAFEDVFDSEVGDTSLVRARNIEREFGLRQLYLKFEGGNPTGSQKDRIAFAQVADALRRGYDGLTVASCGNYGAAVALAASVAGLRCEVFVPATFHTRRTAEIEGLGACIERSPGDYETAVETSQNRAEKAELYDANPGGPNTPLQLQAYGEVASEIYDELRDAPAIVAVPVSNGTTLAGIFKGFVRLYRRGKISRVPRMLGASSFGKNPIVVSHQRGLETCVDLDPQKIRETPVNEPLINWHSYDGDIALHALRESHGYAASASDRKMLRHARLLLENEGLNALPASCAALAVLLERHAAKPLASDRYVVVLTGRR